VAEPVAVGDKVNTSIGLGLASEVVSIGRVVALSEQRAGQLGGSSLAVDIMVTVNKDASLDVEAHSLAIGNSVNQSIGHVVARLCSTSEIVECLVPSILGRRVGRRAVKTAGDKIKDETDDTIQEPNELLSDVCV